MVIGVSFIAEHSPTGDADVPAYQLLAAKALATESFMPSQPSNAHLMRIGYLETPWNTMPSSNSSSACSSSRPLPRDSINR